LKTPSRFLPDTSAKLAPDQANGEFVPGFFEHRLFFFNEIGKFVPSKKILLPAFGTALFRNRTHLLTNGQCSG
jgi:hypothetical protein